MRERDDPAVDYRESHKERGETYDATLSSTPFDAYMTTWETLHVLDLLGKTFRSGIPRYLDFACGTGRVTRLIAPMAAEVVGVDVSASMLDVARAKLPGARFVEADLTATSVDLGRFDLVSAFRFFGNAEPQLRREVLRALVARIRPGGYLLVNSHRNPYSLMAMMSRLQGRHMPLDLSFGLFKCLLGEVGLRIEAVRPIAVWQFRAALAARAGLNPTREGALERVFGAAMWASIAPDAVILARKV